jgi:hypothetical protein
MGNALRLGLDRLKTAASRVRNLRARHLGARSSLFLSFLPLIVKRIPDFQNFRVFRHDHLQHVEGAYGAGAASARRKNRSHESTSRVRLR